MFEFALDLIEEEKRNRTGKLNLGDCGLSDIDKEIPELFELVWLNELNFSSTYYDSSKNKVVSNRNILRGEVKSNFLFQIPIGLKKLVNLEKLIICGTEAIMNENLDDNITDDEKWVISKIENLPSSLKYLDISNNEVESTLNLPISLKTLRISNNNISKIKSIPRNLSTLILRDNNIKILEDLPSSLEFLV